jgi:hypothetical protein
MLAGAPYKNTGICAPVDELLSVKRRIDTHDLPAAKIPGIIIM